MKLTLSFDHQSFIRQSKALEDDIKKAVRPAAQAGAQVLYDAVQINVNTIVGSKSGKLANAIYQVYSADNSEEGIRATYHVSWNTKPGKAIAAAPHGHLIEYGHIQRYHTYIGKDGNWYTDKSRPLKQPVHVAARPFIRPAAMKLEAALDAVQEKFFNTLKNFK